MIPVRTILGQAAARAAVILVWTAAWLITVQVLHHLRDDNPPEMTLRMEPAHEA